MRSLLFLCIIGLAGAGGRTLWWLHSTKYLDKRNWSRGRSPCSTDTAVFPRQVSLEVALPEGLHLELKELVLPEDGGLVFGRYTQLVLSSKDRIDGGCPGEENKWLVAEAGDWTDPENWGGTDLATPDLERVPCPSDTVQIGRDDTDIRIPPLRVTVASIRFTRPGPGGREVIDRESLSGPYEFLEGELWESGEECEDPAGCECPAQPMLHLVCEKVRCPPATCLQPVKPLGDCCFKCSAYLLFGFGEGMSLKAVKAAVGQEVGDEAVWHVSRTMGYVQVVLARQADGQDLDSLARRLNDKLLAGNFGLSHRTLALSGPYYTRSTVASPLFLFFFTLLLAASAFGATFYYFEKGRWRWFGGRRFTFARFENLSGLVEIRSTPRPSVVVRLPGDARGFDNPMYTQERGGSVGQESLLEDDKSESSTDSDLSFDRKTVTTIAPTEEVPIGKLID